MDDSILVTIKNMLNIDADITDFDKDLIVLINSSLSTLHQLGIGDAQFRVTGKDETWSQLLGDKDYYLESVKELVYLDVKIVFDPPTSSIVMEAYKELRQEQQWRIAAEIDMKEENADDSSKGDDTM